MKRLSIILAMVLLPLYTMAQNNVESAFARWNGDKFSMFVHFGLYSHFGGVWNGKPVTDGYSEQIQSFAGIFGDWYAMTADEFDPQSFNARDIVSLAQRAGMRSVVFTSKHHDGFCMFETATTDYNSVARTPAGRDYVRELSKACADAGMNLGLYFSLIDWSYPHAYPISSHNADFVTPQHHEFNKNQVRELLTNYGPISELWFDMGSLQPYQSQELYDLVKELQPECMVSGRLGNDFYDFAVMADNKLPDIALHAPWQSAASMFPETWSYRSWQKRGSADVKVAEKLRTLIDVVSRGGNYLLNIGPDDTGAIVPFEKEVLVKIGQWLEKNGDAIYGTQPSPYDEEFSWGDVTMKGDSLYLLLTGTYPKCGYIDLDLGRNTHRILVDKKMYADPTDVHVIRLAHSGVARRQVDVVKMDSALDWKNATPEYSYSCFDYYSNYRSTVSYTWRIYNNKNTRGMQLRYAASDVGKHVKLQVGDKKIDVTLGNASSSDLGGNVEIVSKSFGRMRGGTFDRATDVTGVVWESVDSTEVKRHVQPFSNYLMKVVLRASEPCRVNLHMITGNGAELLIYDNETGKYVSMMKHLNPYGEKAFDECVFVDLEKGDNELLLRSYNRFEREHTMQFELHQEQTEFTQTVVFDEPLAPYRYYLVRVTNADNPSEHTDCKLHNLKIDLIH